MGIELNEEELEMLIESLEESNFQGYIASSLLQKLEDTYNLE